MPMHDKIGGEAGTKVVLTQAAEIAGGGVERKVTPAPEVDETFM